MDARPVLAAGLAVLAVIPAATAEARTRLRAFANCDQLVAYARTQARRGPGKLTFAYPPSSAPPVTAMPGVASSPAATSTAASSPTASVPEDTSGTNVQEAGIDEPDIVK